MAEQRARPMSPHLGIWRWGPGMTASIFHRISGGALTVAGLAVLTWWLLALADGSDAYGDFSAIAGTWVGLAPRQAWLAEAPAAGPRPSAAVLSGLLLYVARLAVGRF